MNIKVLSRLIAKKRKDKRLSIREVASLAGLTPAGYFKIEKGQIGTPTIKSVMKIAKALDIDVGELDNLKKTLK